ncbi:MAG: hypothetical protein KG028_03880 [Actinobacteria bacterium]|nr:hypothetical protein [Actinomycetota bacterium]
MITRRSPATLALLVLLGLEIAAATAVAVIVVSVVVSSEGAIVGPLEPTALGVLTVAISMLLVVVVMLIAAALGLWRRQPWAPSLTGIVQTLLVVGAGVGLFSTGWQPLLALAAFAGLLGLLLLVGRARREIPD